MESQQIKPHKITKPIQLMATWFSALIIIVGSFLTAAVKLPNPIWIPPTLVISAISFVLLFVVGIFLLQTKFRKEIQDDKHYLEYLKIQAATFESFTPDVIGQDTNTDRELICTIAAPTTAPPDDFCELENLRVQRYEINQGLFLVHSWRPSLVKGQNADIVIWLHQHGDGPFRQDVIEKVEYQLGPYFSDKPIIKRDATNSFRLDVSAYGPMLCVAQVSFIDGTNPLTLERYINFEEAPNKPLGPRIGHLPFMDSHSKVDHIEVSETD